MNDIIFEQEYTLKNIIEDALSGIPRGILKGLVGKTQSKKWHPEGDAWEHTVESLQWVSRQKGCTHDLLVMVLYHDIGKVLTPEYKLPKHIGHDKLGEALIPLIDDIPDRLKGKCAAFCHYHMRKEVKDQKKIDHILEAVQDAGITLTEFCLGMRADGGCEGYPTPLGHRLPEWLVPYEN